MGATLRRGLLVLLVLFAVSPGDVEGITSASTRRHLSHQEIFPTALRYRLQMLRRLAATQHEATQVLPARRIDELPLPFIAASAGQPTDLLYLLMSLQL